MIRHLLSALPLLLLLSLIQVWGVKSDPQAVAPGLVSSDYKSQPASNRRYGYPYQVAPTLNPVIQARVDEFKNDEPRIKVYGSKIPSSERDGTKKQLKKSKDPYVYGAVRRQDDAQATSSKNKQSYLEPKYRNFDDLESNFGPKRRVDLNYPYSQYDYSNERGKRPLSPRDPYLSPSDEPRDTFYPLQKTNDYPTYGNRYTSGPTYGAGHYDEPYSYHMDDAGYTGGSYGAPSPSHPSSGGHYQNYPQEYATINSNEPIIGDIRKKLLEYAGASDLYEGEPDYLQEVSQNKYKYGNIANDYYSYSGPGYKDFPYVESKIRLIKKARL